VLGWPLLTSTKISGQGHIAFNQLEIAILVII
jgi:hypothetical protein